MQTKRIRTLKKKRTRLAQVKKDMKGVISKMVADRHHRTKLKIYQDLSLLCGRSLIQALLPEGLSEGYRFKCSRFSLQADLITR
jgi:hypothetical protein